MSSSDEQSIIVAIDVGSSSVRCSAYHDNDNKELSVIDSTSKEMRTVHPNTGKIQLSVVETVDQCIDELLQKLDHDQDRYTVSAVGFSTFVMNLVGVDASGELIGEEATVSYACNTPSVAKEVEKIKSELGEEGTRQLYEKTGAPLHSAYALAQMRVLHSEKPELSRRIDKWQTLASVCLARWTGKTHLSISYSEASWTGLFNYRTCSYESTALQLLPSECRNALPETADFYCDNESISGIPESSRYWERWTALRNARLFLGLGDGACANIGSKCSTADRIACTVGTSAAARVCLPLPVSQDDNAPTLVEPGLFCYRIDRSHVLVGGALTDGGSVVEWISHLLNMAPVDSDKFQECLKEAAELLEEDYQNCSTASSPTLTVVPLLSGERSTGFRSGATGAVLGLTRETTPAHLLKACLEGVTMRLAAIVKLLMTVTGKQDNDATPRIMASGKALEFNDLWRRMLADCTGLGVILDRDTEEGTSRGVAKLVSVALTMEREQATDSTRFLTTENVQSSCSCQPRQEARIYWDRACNVQESLLEAISPLYSKI